MAGPNPSVVQVLPALPYSPDVRLVQSAFFPNQQSVTVDWLLRDDGTLDDTQALSSAVVIALGTDGLANSDDLLPDPELQR